MYSRSVLKDNEGQGNQFHCLIGDEQVTVRAYADDVPSRLGQRIAEGEDVMSIWFDWGNQSELQSVGDRIGYHLQLSIHQMSRQDILSFCRTINVHPAHLVPLKPAPEFSLPRPLLELLIDMSQKQGMAHLDDVQLARVAIESERKRINHILYTQSRQEAINADGAKAITKIFGDVLSNPVLMTKLSRETTEVHNILADEAESKYPLAMRVRNVAVSGIKDSFNALKNSQREKEAHLDQMLEYVEEEFSQIFDPKTSHKRILLFISDIKDALIDKNIQPRAATTANIMGVIKNFDFKGSLLQTSYDYCKTRFGGMARVESIKEEFLIDISTYVSAYFSSENRLSKSKRRISEEIDNLPTDDELKNLFEDPSFKEGTLFRRLMENYAVIALAQHNSKAHPTASPK